MRDSFTRWRLHLPLVVTVRIPMIRRKASSSSSTHRTVKGRSRTRPMMAAKPIRTKISGTIRIVRANHGRNCRLSNGSSFLGHMHNPLGERNLDAFLVEPVMQTFDELVDNGVLVLEFLDPQHDGKLDGGISEGFIM